METAIAIRLAASSSCSEISGLNTPLSKSRDIDDEMANNRPAAVDNAAANPPAATKAQSPSLEALQFQGSPRPLYHDQL